MEFRKIVLMNPSTWQQWRCRQREQTYGHSEGERRWDDLREQPWNIHITICKVHRQWEFSVWHREPKVSALWQPRGVGWGKRFKREGTYAYLWLIYADVWQKPPQYCKVTVLQFKIFKNYFKKESACQCTRHTFNPWVRKILWKRNWQPTPVFLPGKCHGQRSLAGYGPWGLKRVGHDFATKQQNALKLLLWNTYLYL